MIWAYSSKNGWLTLVSDASVEKLAETYTHMIYFEAELTTS